MKRIISFLLCIAPCFGFSQKKKNIVPGYLGKKLEFNYRFATFPVLKRLGEDLELIDGNYPHGIEFFIKHQFMLNYTMARKVSAGISYAFSNSYVYFSDDVSVNGGGLPVYRPYKPFFSHYIGINFRVFQKNFFAPVGIYHQIEIGKISYGLISDSLHFYAYKLNPVYTNGTRYDTTLVKVDMKNKYSSNYIRYGININTAISKRFMLNAGISVGYIFGGDAAITYIKGAAGMPADRLVPSVISRYLRWEQVFNYHLGIGFMIF